MVEVMADLRVVDFRVRVDLRIMVDPRVRSQLEHQIATTDQLLVIPFLPLARKDDTRKIMSPIVARIGPAVRHQSIHRSRRRRHQCPPAPTTPKSE